MRWFWLWCFSCCAAVSGAEPPQRIASYSPGATQTLLDLGSSAQIVATTRWCPLPKAHPAVRTCDAFNPDLETLLQAKPELVILPRLANPLWAERCTRAGLKIIILQTESPDSVTRDLELLGEATHQQVAAKALRAQLDRPPASGPRTLLIVWDGMMAGPDAYTRRALNPPCRLAAGSNSTGKSSCGPTPMPFSGSTLSRRIPPSPPPNHAKKNCRKSL